MGGISVWQLLIVLIMVVLLFGSKRLRSLGADLRGLAHSYKAEQEAESQPPG